MKTKKNMLFVLISLLSLGACAQPGNWNGIYEYESVLGENTAEETVVVEYIFTLDDEKCLIKSQGYQTDETIICSTEKTEKELTVKFQSYGDGSTKNIYDVEVYPSQSTLFTLIQKDSKLTTKWGVLAPDESFSTGEYFAKQP